MRVTPKTENEVRDSGLWPVGEYDFEIVSSIEKLSQSGNEMIELKVKIFDEDGKSITLFDYLLESVAYKLRHCSSACGVIDKYESGELSGSDFLGKTGRLKLRIQPEKNGYPAKNSISDYVVPSGNVVKSSPRPAAKSPPPTPSTMDDDDIPF